MTKLLRDASPSPKKNNTDSFRLTHSKTSSANTWRKSFLFPSLLVFILAISACKDPNEVGLDVLPKTDLLNAVFADTSTIVCTTIVDDSVKGDELSAQLIGTMNDPEFGITNASVYAQVNLEGTPVFTDTPVADSMIISLAYAGYYGDTAALQTLNVYRMNELMSIDSFYYTNRDFTYDPSPLASVQFQPRPNTHVLVGTDTTFAQLRIALPISFADSILALNGQTELSSNTEWLNYFKGIYLLPNTSLAVGNGSVNYFSFYNSNVTLYFHDATTTAKTYTFSLTGARTNHFTHDYTGTSLASQLNDPAYGDSLNYVQPMGSVKTRISMPYLKHFLDSGNLIINKAQLEITGKAGVVSPYNLPANMYLITRNASGSYIFPIDYYESTGYFGGQLNTAGNGYTFTITRQLQRYLDGVVTNADFDLVVSGSGVLANRLILGSGKNSSYRMKLSLYYTRIK